MVRIPSFARRPEETTATEDRNRDGRVDRRDERTDTADRPVADARTVAVRDQVDDRGDRRPAGTATATADVDTRREQADRAAAERTAAEGAADRAETERAAGRVEAERERAADRTVDTVPPARKPRASLLATLGLVVSVAAALMVLTGVLAGYGVAAGIIGLLLSIGGLSATGKPHVAGKSDALLGIVLSLSAMIVGALALTGSLSWLTTETDKVDQFRQWLDSQFGGRF